MSHICRFGKGDHKENCIQVNGTQAIKMPTKDKNILKFENFHKQQAVPFVIYADFEAITEKISGCKPNDDKSYTQEYQRHTDCGYGYIRLCVALMTNTLSRYKYIGVKKLYTNSWKRCWKKLSIVNKL